MSEKQKAKIFVSYAHDDKSFFEVFSLKFKNSLKTSTRFEWEVWNDKDFKAIITDLMFFLFQ